MADGSSDVWKLGAALGSSPLQGGQLDGVPFSHTMPRVGRLSNSLCDHLHFSPVRRLLNRCLKQLHVLCPWSSHKQEVGNQAALRRVYAEGHSRVAHLVSQLTQQPVPQLSPGAVGLELSQRPACTGQSNMTKVCRVVAGWVGSGAGQGKEGGAEEVGAGLGRVGWETLCFCIHMWRTIQKPG